MNLPRFLLIAVLVTTAALGYLHQQVELLKISYSINYNKNNLALLLDRNSTLMYNVNNLQCPLYMERALSAKNVNLEIPAHWHAIAFAETGMVK